MQVNWQESPDFGPYIFNGEAFWRKVIDFEALAEFGTISPDDINLLSFVETAGQACEIITKFYREHNPNVSL